MNNQEYFERIIAEIYQIPSPKIDISRKENILSFLTTTVNGDIIQDFLVIDATLPEGLAVFVYVLTNRRVIRVVINSRQEITSSGFLLSTITGVDRKLSETDNRIEIKISFDIGVTGLRYSAKSQKITEFFQKVEQSWTKG